MEDQGIIALFFKRSEQAIEETARRHIQAQDAAGKEPADAEPDLYCD